MTVQWEVPPPLPGMTVDQFTMRTKLHDAVGSDEHKAVVVELKAKAAELAEALFEVLSEVRTKALPFCCASTVFPSKTVPFHRATRSRASRC
eukprot:SAG22_NODE_3709_length_1563_cov_1.665984_4_plen_92_part_00